MQSKYLSQTKLQAASPLETIVSVDNETIVSVDNKVSMSRYSKVIARTDGRTHTDTTKTLPYRMRQAVKFQRVQKKPHEITTTHGFNSQWKFGLFTPMLS